MFNFAQAVTNSARSVEKIISVFAISYKKIPLLFSGLANTKNYLPYNLGKYQPAKNSFQVLFLFFAGK